MTSRSDADLEEMPARSDPTMRRLIHDLDRACAASMPARAREEIARELAVAVRGSIPVTGRRPVRRPEMFDGRGKLLSVAAAILLVLSGIAGYLRLQAPTSASAAEVLRRGASAVADIPAGGVVHEVVQVRFMSSNAPPFSAARDDMTSVQWTQVDGQGHPLQVDLQTTSRNPALDERMVADAHGTMWIYGARPNVVTKSRWTPGKPLFGGPSLANPRAIDFLPKEMMDSPQDPSTLHNLLMAVAGGTYGRSRLLARQTIGGRAVDVVQVTHPDPSANLPHGWSSDVYTIYLDAATHLVRRIDTRGVNVHGGTVFDQSFDVITYRVVSISAVPSGTFTFTPAPGTRVCTGPNPVRCTTVKSHG